MKAPEVGASVTVLTEPVDSRVLDFRRGDRATVVAIDPPNHGRFRFTCEVERSGQRYRFAQDELRVTRCSCGKPFPEDGGTEGVCECCSGCAT